MKKHITLLLFVLISSLIWAGPFTPESGKLYHLRLASKSLYAKIKSATASNPAATFDSEGSPFRIVKTTDGYTFYATDVEAYLNYTTANNWNTVMQQSPTAWQLNEGSTVGQYAIAHSFGGNTFYLGNGANYQTVGGGIFCGETAPLYWIFEEVEAISYDVIVTGLPEATKGGVIYASEPYYGGDKIPSSTKITAAQLSPINVEGYHAKITVNDSSITVAYIENLLIHNPQYINDFLNRIGGSTTSSRITTILDESLLADGHDCFVISSADDKPLITGSSPSAITAGIGWYLNHYAHINLSWNQLTADLSAVALPVPAAQEKHTCDADYRYYLNYCTFGYSMTTWTWERWQKEIDWMALHGINMPLQIIGLEQVWRETLKHYNYTDTEAMAFAAGPAFTAWWGMNNLEGWGGTTDPAWFARQTTLARKICERERELGMQPVLPGFAAVVPHDFTKKNPGYATESQGNWGSAFIRPYIMDPSGEKFAEVAHTYYNELERVMGQSLYYSMDPFHEGGAISSGKYSEGYRAIFDAMNTCCGADSKWVIQQWQWASYQAVSLNAVPAGRLLVLDLFADGNPAFDRYAGYAPQDAIYCTIPNFGGRTGYMGRIPKMADNYFRYKAKYPSVRGIGAAPEAIESVPVVYDLLFELPWMGSAPDTKEWMADYTRARYNNDIEEAAQAWEAIRTTALNETTTLQGPHEAVMCGRPALSINAVSKWGGSNIFYDQQKFIGAAYQLMNVARTLGTSGSVGADNMSYDLCDIVRQVMSDYSKSLLAGIKAAHESSQKELFNKRRDAFLALILDTDRLLGTNQMFRLGNWTETARQAAAEVEGATTATPDWYELDNARTLITTWGDREASEWGLRDYSYRQWQGLLSDYYYPRWKYWFDHNMQAPTNGWFYSEWNWAHELAGQWGATAKGTHKKSTRTYYTAAPEGSTLAVAQEVMGKYILPLTLTDGTTQYAYRSLSYDLRGRYEVVQPGEEGKALPEGIEETEVVSFDINAAHEATLTLTDGTELKYDVVVSPLSLDHVQPTSPAQHHAYDLAGRPFAKGLQQGVVLCGGHKTIR